MAQEYKIFSITMPSGVSLTNELDLGRVWNKVYLDPTNAAAEVRLQSTDALGGTYRQVYHPAINSSTVGANIFKIPSSVSGGIIELPAGLRFIKVETTAAIGNGTTFKVICSTHN